MKSYEDFIAMNQDELYDYKEVVGEDWALLEFLTARLIYRQEKEKNSVKMYQWGDD